MFPATSLAEISRNTSVISSSSSSSSTSDLTDQRPQRPPRQWAAPRSASDNVRHIPAYIQRVEQSYSQTHPPLTKPRFISPHDFDFGDILGHGSYSTVIQAHGKKSGKTYAIKVLDKAHLQRHNQHKTAYAEKEALVVLGTTHPDFVLDYLPNGDLRALISRYGSLSLQCTCYYIAQLIDALAYIHSMGVMHRDIKPENLLLDARFRLALADFGTAKVLSSQDSTNQDPTLRRSNSFVGTPQYYSPELLASTQTSPSSDLWALGCVLFEMHTGTFAFNGPSPLLTWRLIKALDYTLPDGFDADAADLVRNLLVVDPEERLGSGKEGKDMAALKAHSFFSGVDWARVWDDSHPPLESGLKQPPEPVSPMQSDAELSAQLREERRVDEDEDDEMGWDKDAKIMAYLPGLRHTNGNGLGAAENGVSSEAPRVGEYTFPRAAGVVDGELPFDAPTDVVEQKAEIALEQPVNVDIVETGVGANETGTGLTSVPPVPVSTPIEAVAPPPESPSPVGSATPPETATPPPRDVEFALLLQPKETITLCTPLVPEPSTPGGLVRLLPRLLSGSLRAKKPKLKERVLILTNRRVLCVSVGKSVPIVKADYALFNGSSAAGMATIVKGVEKRGEDGLILLTVSGLLGNSARLR
ncbi:hypothetical protein H0H92_008883 [Tricholoma furcatifolium]|nr:hypothetical protein H0H92_008883 [Tricholoma furcatifolium]